MKNFFLYSLFFCFLSFEALTEEFKSELLDAASKKVTDVSITFN